MPIKNNRQPVLSLEGTPFVIPLPAIQLAIDVTSIDEALRIAEIGVAAGVDILEVGTPLVVHCGVAAIDALVRAFPQMPVLVDYKSMDSGGKNVHLTKLHGAQAMTVCAGASDETILAAVAAAKETGVHVAVDTIGVKNQAQRARQCAEWGVDSLFLHYGADQRRNDSTRSGVQWLAEVVAAVDIPVGIATMSAKDSVVGAGLGAQLFAIGHPLISGPDPSGDLRDFVDRVKGACAAFAMNR